MADRVQFEANNEFADVTIFQSHYSLDAHKELGIEFKNPVVIRNAVDPSIFYPSKETRTISKDKIGLIATSWSIHPNKGHDVYKWLDQKLDWDRYYFTFVGRTVAEFDNIRNLKEFKKLLPD